MYRIIILLLVAAGISSCNSGHSSHQKFSADELFAESDTALAYADGYTDTIEIRYAQGLQIKYEADGVHVRISNPAAHSATPPVELVVRRPASRFICTTALQLGNFEVLGLEDRIVGMNSLRNLFSAKIRAQMEGGQTTPIGKEGNFDLETVIALQPDYIFVSASKHGGFEALRSCGIPLIPHHGYKETSPLGQAEWIKLIGLLTGETRRANAVFDDIEQKYLTLREEVERSKLKYQNQPLPTVISGRQMRDGWYIAGGRSYMAQLFADAGADYVMSDNTDTGGTALDFEAVYARGIHAQFWQTDGSYQGDFTLDALAAEDPRYATMDAFKAGHVLFCNLAQTPYRELAGVQPHFMLADFVKAFHPELLPSYEPRYYKLLK